MFSSFPPSKNLTATKTKMNLMNINFSTDGAAFNEAPAKPNLRVDISFEGTKENDFLWCTPTGSERSKLSPKTPPKSRRSLSPSPGFKSSPTSPFTTELGDIVPIYTTSKFAQTSRNNRKEAVPKTCPKNLSQDFSSFRNSLETPSIKRKEPLPWTCDKISTTVYT